jgi:protein transport protein SEC31
LNNPTTPYTPGTRSAKMDDISSVAWNCQVQHILSTASTNGYTVVWDLRNKKEVMTLAHSGQSAMMGSGRGSISSIAWHPNIVSTD